MSSPTKLTDTFCIQRQTQIYQNGLEKRTPALPIAPELLERKAKEKMSPEAFDFAAGGAGSEDTVRANLEAFRQWRIVPRMLRDISTRDMGVQIFGQRFSVPVMLAPVGVQEIYHPEAELPVARAAASLGVPLVLSCLSSNTLEQVGQVLGQTPRWFQLYWPKDPELTASFLVRAERAGYSAVVVTMDSAFLAWRERDLQRGYLPFLLGKGMANYWSDPVFRRALIQRPEENRQEAIRHFMAVACNPAITWKDLAFLRQQTKLPILLKGILHPDDAAKALDHGMDGIIVSNHGGRQMDGGIATLDALLPIVKTVGDRMPVLFDGGIRRGADAFKAIALGAKAVLLGRPYIYGLGIAGEAGVRDVLLNFLADLALTLALSGHTSFSEVNVADLFDSAWDRRNVV